MGPLSFCGLELAHPVVNGSGTFDAIAARRAFGDALLRAPTRTESGWSGFPFSAFVSKTITLRPRAGNPPPRLWEAPAGLVNSIGLPNRGLAGYLEHDLPQLAALPVPLVTNVMGSTAAELCALVEAVGAREEVAAIELNVSCPNVRTGLDLGADPATLAGVLAEVRPRTRKPLIVKLTPNTADVAVVAAAAQDAGADAVSLINTLRAFAPAPLGGAVADRSGPAGADPPGRAWPAGADPPGRAWLGGETGGLSGPAVRAAALAQVRSVASRVDIPVVGMGGIQTAEHAAQFLSAGATLVAVGTESFRDPLVAARVAEGLDHFLAKSGNIAG